MGTSQSSQSSSTPSAPPNQPNDDDERRTPAPASYWDSANEGYKQLVDAIIRPPRAEYRASHLGPRSFSFSGRNFARKDFDLRNKRGMKLKVSHWEPVESERRAMELPCIIYMHGNSSARVEALPQLALCLGLGASMLAFDFSGSGKSDGEYVSLGYYERDDLDVVVQHLRESQTVSTIALWGRSMGAACSLMHGDRDPSIAAMVLDSPFADLTMLAEEMVDKGREQGLMVPSFVVSIALSFIRSSVKKAAGFNIRDISPIKRVDACFIPALFVAARDDDFILPHHAQRIHAKYAGDKNLVLVDGDHNSPRPRFLFDSAFIFLQTCLRLDQSWALENADPFNGGHPPWVADGRFMALMRFPADGTDTEEETDLEEMRCRLAAGLILVLCQTERRA